MARLDSLTSTPKLEPQPLTPTATASVLQTRVNSHTATTHYTVKMEDLKVENIGKLRVVQLRAHLKSVGLPVDGRKAELVRRCTNSDAIIALCCTQLNSTLCLSSPSFLRHR